MRLIDADALGDLVDSHGNVHYEDILHQPTIEPQRMRGRWIDKSGGIEGAWNYCSVCGEQAIDLYDFCPNCGADMRGTDDANC